MAPLSKDPDAIRKLESLRYVFRSPQNALESDERTAYEWLEDSVIRKITSVEIKKDEAGKDSATIKMKNPDTNKKEVVYYTTDETEIARLKDISEGKTVIVEVPQEDSETEIKD